ncbi:MAG: DUF7520 family protein [Halococcoides sp.]
MDTDTASPTDDSQEADQAGGNDASAAGATGEEAESAAAEPALEITGRQAVVGIYLVAVVLAAAFGFVLALTVDPSGVAELGPITFSITPLNLAVYGALSVGVGLGVFVGLAAWVAGRNA